MFIHLLFSAIIIWHGVWYGELGVSLHFYCSELLVCEAIDLVRRGVVWD